MILIFSLVAYSPLKVETYFTDYQFPLWARVLGWLLFVLLIAPLFFCAVKAYIESPAETVKKVCACDCGVVISISDGILISVSCSKMCCTCMQNPVLIKNSTVSCSQSLNSQNVHLTILTNIVFITLQKFVNISSPSLLWGPALEVHRLDLMTNQSSEAIIPSSRRAYDKSRSPCK